jgi:hypothetical protein
MRAVCSCWPVPVMVQAISGGKHLGSVSAITALSYWGQRILLLFGQEE